MSDEAATMTPAQALLLLSQHSGRHDDVHHPKWESGFLGALRPYRGQLDVANFHEVMTALRVLAAQLEAPQVDRNLVSALWNICHLARMWAVAPEGMLQSNRLIAPADVARIERWIDCVSYAVLCLLDGAGVDEAFHEYDNADEPW
ncbi:hypothetical protein [Eleftheria terrae]|uniref:hypothetical protein n=1 Tax=Eleftheria terrae TaxID=1597781 RepID=UPI00263B3263|nr:hypothetical protein [Eleftheria terrae]WKB54688.1 hypothetical protein N7L95_10025 [Eleftheria terrae]